ncbi:MAG TPA: response regulator [Nitrolancea sp.]|nr:response regulator [Nitrolancea sp.]
MPSVTALLVENDPKVAWAISRVIEARGFPSPVVFATGGETIDWIGRNRPDLCFIDRDLPDVKWADFIVRIRQRQPNVPIHLISGAGTEADAIAAFRAGVTDYIPKAAGLYESIIRALQRASEKKAESVTPGAVVSVPEGIPPQLLNPTYQNRLRVIGRQIDLYGYRMVAVFEVEGGFLMRAFRSNGRQAEALEFPDRDFAQLVIQAFVVRGEGERPASNSQLLPSGYEDFFRAIGAALDDHKADAVSVSEFSSIIVVSGNVQVENSTQTTVGNLQWVLQAEDVTQILDEGYRRRKSSGKAQSGSVLDRIFGRQEPIQASSTGRPVQRQRQPSTQT